MKEKVELFTMHPYESAILNLFIHSAVDLTAGQVAKTLKIHPKTAQKWIDDMENSGEITCKQVGNRKYCRISET